MDATGKRLQKVGERDVGADLNRNF